MKIIAFALRRSGSTAFWEIFNSNAKYLALDEPFNPMLIQLPLMHPKQTWQHFVDIYQQSSHLFKKKFAPISKEEELNTNLSPANENYINYLVQNKANWFMDVTRCQLKLKRMAEVFPDARAVHLFRKPMGFVSSHLLPSYGGWHTRKNRLLGELFFWRKQSGFNYWSMETLYNKWFHHLETYFPSLDLPTLPGALKTAHERLLLFWLFHYRFVEYHGRVFFKERFYSICFDELCQSPAKTLDALFVNSGECASDFKLSHLKSVHPGFKRNHSNWITAMKKVGFSEAEIKRWT